MSENSGGLMKRLLVGLLALGSISAFSQDGHKVGRICGGVGLISSNGSEGASFRVVVPDNELIALRITDFKSLNLHELSIVTAAKTSDSRICVNYELSLNAERDPELREITLP